jgi:hypothetical protein
MTRNELAGKVVVIIRKGGRPIMTNGWVWRGGAYPTGKYSLLSFLAWNFSSRNRRLDRIFRRFSSLFKHTYAYMPRIITALIAVQGFPKVLTSACLLRLQRAFSSTKE